MFPQKVRLEADGHTAVRPTEFFLVEESPSTLLIILRNEDIAEHICEVTKWVSKRILANGVLINTTLNEWLSLSLSQVPYLLRLKKFPGVQFVGLDEPDDVLNQTHQELFVRGGFIMFDSAALESLSFCEYLSVGTRQKVTIDAGFTHGLCEFKVRWKWCQKLYKNWADVGGGNGSCITDTVAGSKKNQGQNQFWLTNNHYKG